MRTIVAASQRHRIWCHAARILGEVVENGAILANRCTVTATARPSSSGARAGTGSTQRSQSAETGWRHGPGPNHRVTPHRTAHRRQPPPRWPKLGVLPAERQRCAEKNRTSP